MNCALTILVFLAVVLMPDARQYGRLERLAYERAEQDYRTAADRGLRFDEQEADRSARFFSKFLKFGKGEWAGKPFVLAPWEEFIVRELFGWKRADGTRRYRTGYVEVPRKNGKTELAAGIGLLLLTFDHESSPEVYAAATKKDQSRIVFRAAKDMVRQSRDLKRYLRAMQTSIVCDRNGGTFTPLSSDYNSLDGLNVSGAIVDELHAHKTRDLWDVLISACGARRQPLILAITTAGIGQRGICWEQRDYAEKILSGVFEDDTYFAFIANAEPDDDWQDEAIWRKANPNYGISVKPDFIREHCERAKRSIAYQNTFRRYYLNQWLEQVERWIDMDQWRACADPIDPELLKGRECWLGIDMSRTIDLTAGAAVFLPSISDPKWRILTKAWAPEERAYEREHSDKVPYTTWARTGAMVLTPGNVVDYSFIDAWVKECCERFDVHEICYDPWNATKWATDLQTSGISNLVEVRQGIKTMSPACKELERLLAKREIGHDGNPVAAWCASNICVRHDANENLAPDKVKSTERIDTIVAILTAMSRAIVSGGMQTISYDGLAVIA